MGEILAAANGKQAEQNFTDKKEVVFSCRAPQAATKYSEPQAILLVQKDIAKREIRVIGEDGNVRVCKVDRLPSTQYANELYATLKAAKDSETVVCFMAAGGFSPDKWFYDICKG
jgi:hypothetical protein